MPAEPKPVPASNDIDWQDLVEEDNGSTFDEPFVVFIPDGYYFPRGKIIIGDHD
jgi:hypothetical protein